jgi:hypothetical protein
MNVPSPSSCWLALERRSSLNIMVNGTNGQFPGGGTHGSRVRSWRHMSSNRTTEVSPASAQA